MRPGKALRFGLRIRPDVIIVIAAGIVTVIVTVIVMVVSSCFILG